MEKQIRAMVVSMGGTTAPVVYSLNEARPEYVCYFVSGQSKLLIGEVRKELAFEPTHFDWIETPNPEILSECYRAVVSSLPAILRKWGVRSEEVCVDYTGGTKTMSAALVMATIGDACCYSYVGGDERSKGGVGVVLDGKERRWFLDNPWDEIALVERREAFILFNKARYASAAEALGRSATKVTEERKPLMVALNDLVEGYDLWDRFRHGDARKRLFKARDVLMTYAGKGGSVGGKTFIQQFQRNLAFIESFPAGGLPSVHHFRDLLGNAWRRAALESKFDDAVARLYRAMEVLVQAELRTAYEIDTSDVDEAKLPGAIHEEYVLRYRDKEDGKIRVPMFGAYRLLKELGSRLADRFFARSKEIRAVLDIRNHSILAHGFGPVREETFNELWKSICDFSGLSNEELPRFPELNVDLF